MQRLKILHILPWIVSGGVEKRRAMLAQGLDPVRFEQRFVCKELAPMWADPIRASGATLDLIEGDWRWHDLNALGQIVKIIEQWRPHVVHGAVFEGVVMTALAGKITNTPVTVIEETGATPHRRAGGHALMALMSALSDRCIAVSPFAKDYLIEHSLIPAEKIHTILNGTRFPDALSASAREQQRRALGLAPEHFVIGAVGRIFNLTKRYTDLIDVIGRSPDHFRLMIVGDGVDLDFLKGYVARAGLQARVLFPGRQQDMGPMYSVMDCFAHASTIESFGLVIVEAMSMGLPVVATRVGAIPTIIEDGRSGLLFEPTDTDALLAHLTRLAQDSALRERLGQHAAQTAQRDYSEAGYLARVTRFYDQLRLELGLDG